MDIDKISLIALIFLNIILSAKFLFSQKDWTGKTLSILSSHLAVSALWLAEILLLVNRIGLDVYESVLCFFLGWVFGIMTMQVSILSIVNMTRKKLTTLWKTPIVASLASMLLKVDYIGFLLLGFLGICLFLVYQNRPRLRYLLPKLLWASFSLPLFFLFDLAHLWILNLGLIIFVLTTNVFHNLIFASNLLAVHEEE